MMRTLQLTSPEMRGEDVRTLQHRLNERLQHYRSRSRVKEDGVYGRETAHLVREVAWTMGLDTFGASVGVQHDIEHPHLRSPLQLRREHERAQERIHTSKIAGDSHGLEAVVAHARSYLGIKEIPAGSNWGKPVPARWEENFGFDTGVSWCACFACSMVNDAGGHVHGECGFCPAIEGYARAKINGFDLWVPNHTEGVKPGWLVLYNWVGGSEPEHIGVVEKITPTHVVAIEGNTSGSNPSDGGMVARMERPYSFTVGYARPRF